MIVGSPPPQVNLLSALKLAGAQLDTRAKPPLFHEVEERAGERRVSDTAAPLRRSATVPPRPVAATWPNDRRLETHITRSGSPTRSNGRDHRAAMSPPRASGPLKSGAERTAEDVSIV